MCCRSITWLICTFVAVAIATGYSGQDSSTGSHSEVAVHHIRTDNLESSTADPLQKPNTAVELGSLLDAGHGAMVALVAGDTRLVAHRAVLSARSPVFQHMLQDISIGEVTIPDMEGPVLRQLLAYLYTLQAPQLPAMAPQLLAAAHQYGLPALKADCEQQVAKQLSVENAAATAALAITHSSDSLRKAAIVYIRAHLLHVMATQGWADAVKSQPQVMVKVMQQLLSESPAETSTPASAASRTSPTIEAQSVRSSRDQTAAPAASPSTSDSSVSSGSTNCSLLCSSAPAAGGSSPYPATQPHSDYSGHQTPTTAAPTTVAQTITSTDDVHISSLRTVSPEDKTRRLMEAAKQGAVGELEALLAAGADVGARDMYQWTPLHEAAAKGHAAVVRLLLANNADHSASTNYGSTPLHYAAGNGHTEAATALLEAGAERGARDNNGETPLDTARRNNKQQVVQLLQGTAA